MAKKLIGLFSLTYLCFHGRRGCHQPVRISVKDDILLFEKPFIL
jgi:hypothetical protein